MTRQSFVVPIIAGTVQMLPAMGNPYRLVTVFGSFTNTTGAKDYPRLELYDGAGNTVAFWGNSNGVPNAQTAKITWSVGCQSEPLSTTDNVFPCPIPPDLVVDPNWTVRITSNMADGWTDLVFVFEMT